MKMRTARRAFTITELLVVLALLLIIMATLANAFVAGIQTLRELKALGDLAERLRTSSLQLRRDLAESHFEGMRLIAEGLRTGVVDPDEADDLREQYEEHRAKACELQSALVDLYRVNMNPVARRVFEQTINALEGVKETAQRIIDVLELVNPPR